MLSLKLNKEADELTKELTKWLKSNKPPEASLSDLDNFVEVSRKWQAALAKERFVGVHWPQEYGGRGYSVIEEAISQELLAEAGSPQLVNLFGLTMAGPVIIEHGTDEQKKRYLAKILSADEIWCQGFSEPGAGSDLSAVSTQASLIDGLWRINGQKVWTSFAQYADWVFVLARSSKAEKAHHGLSYLFVPMDQEGIETRPITQITGDQEFNEVFFNDATTEQSCLVGSEGDGWKIAISTLMYERVILTFARHLQSEEALRNAEMLVEKNGSRPEHIERLSALKAENDGVRCLALSHLFHYSKGNSPGPEGSLDKLAWSELFQDISKFCFELAGTSGLAADSLEQHRYLYSRGRTIAAGTSEIQRSIIAERVLGLPRGR